MLAPAAQWHDPIVSGPRARAEPPNESGGDRVFPRLPPPRSAWRGRPAEPTWAELLRREFAVDVMTARTAAELAG